MSREKRGQKAAPEDLRHRLGPELPCPVTVPTCNTMPPRASVLSESETASQETRLNFGDITKLTVVAHEGGVGDLVGLDPSIAHVLQHLMSSWYVACQTICIHQGGEANHSWSDAAACHLTHHLSSPALHTHTCFTSLWPAFNAVVSVLADAVC